MNIQMIGIDHSTADVKIREQFAFTASQADRAMEELRKQPGLRGCVLLSTCNRMELYVSAGDGAVSLFGLLEKILQFPTAEYQSFFRIRKSEEAVAHLFYLTAGLKSRILGEDQILTQVKDALRKARELYCTDTLLEVLFRRAVTAGKEVKTNAWSVHPDFSVVHCAIDQLCRQGYRLEGKKCLVIGNGQMGKIAAAALREAGASVTVTVRQYRSGMVEIPKGCDRIAYGERYEWIPECDVVVSATVSPNLTIRKDSLAQALGAQSRPQIFIDLAVPRDMEEEIAQLDGVTLYNIDSFRNDTHADFMEEQKQAAEKILADRIAEFKDWYECRDLIPRIRQISGQAAEELCWRMGRADVQLPQKEQEALQDMLRNSAEKVVARMLYTLRDELAREELYHCMDILEHIQY